MINIKFRNAALAAWAMLLSIILFASCKKSSGPTDGPTLPAEFYLTATVDGKAWSANIKNGDNNVAGGTSGGLLFVIGAQALGTDSSALVIAFPSNPQLNAVKAFDPLQKSVAAYSTKINQFSADPAVNGSGSYVIKGKNDSSRVVEGTFNFTAMRVKGSGASSVKVTDGKFRTVYRDNMTPELPGNLKQ
ncbi:MAG: hypothetical protein H0X41_02940 [Chitinophagaceae bacterium]|nr:hypothetical protein [Chitinophagaceae bacterium]